MSRFIVGISGISNHDSQMVQNLWEIEQKNTLLHKKYA